MCAVLCQTTHEAVLLGRRLSLPNKDQRHERRVIRAQHVDKVVHAVGGSGGAALQKRKLLKKNKTVREKMGGGAARSVKYGEKKGKAAGSSSISSISSRL